LHVLLDGVLRARGRLWIATRPDEVLALEAAGGVLRVAQAGPWLGVLSDWSQINVERALMASLRWDDRFEDREQALVVIVHAADPKVVNVALQAALVTDAELAAGEQAWRLWADPFGALHSDPCEPAEPAEAYDQDRRSDRQRR
jgi:hypothetical protein